MDDTVVQLTSDMSDVRWQGWQDHEYLTASNLNSFFHFGCQLELWKSFHEGHVPRRYESPSSISRAHISRGHQWEKSLIRCLDAENLILRMSKRTTFEAQVVADPRNHFYVINSEFKERNLFVNEYLSRRTTPVAFGTFKPDFIEVWKRVELGRLVIDYHVIDAKASYALHVCAFITVLTLDCSSSTSLRLLARAARTASFRYFCTDINGFDMALERGQTYSIFARNFETSNGFISVLNTSASRTSSS